MVRFITVPQVTKWWMCAHERRIPGDCLRQAISKSMTDVDESSLPYHGTGIKRALPQASNPFVLRYFEICETAAVDDELRVWRKPFRHKAGGL